MNNNKLDALKAIKNAISIKEIADVLAGIARKSGALISIKASEESKKKAIRTFLMAGAMTCIFAVTYCAWVGGAYISKYAGPISIFFGVLDATIVGLLYTNAITGIFRWIALCFEGLSLLYMGYAMTGFFGGGNLQTAAESKLIAAYNVAKDHYTAADATADLMQKAINNAAGVLEIEEKRDGPGVVSEKAELITKMKTSSFQMMDSLPPAKTFKDLASGNKWLQDQRQVVASHLSKYDAGLSAMSSQAKSTYQGLKDALKMTMSDQQRNNLQSLAASMEELATKKPIESKISNEVLAPGDLKADGFQNYIGYLAEGVILFFIVMLMAQKSSDKNLDEIQDQEMKGLIEDMLSEEGIAYDTEMLKDISASRQYEAVKLIFGSDDMKKYLKIKVSFHDFVVFLKDYPQLARALGGSMWQLVDIKKELQKNPSFASVATNAIKVSPADWKTLVTITPNPDHLFEMDEETRNKFIQVLKQVQAKGQFKDGELRSFMARFLLEQDPSDTFMKNLEVCASTLTSPEKLKQLKHLTGGFMNATTPNVAKFLCETSGNDIQFRKIVSGWNTQHNDSMSEILNNGIVEEANFSRFMKFIMDSGGLDGMKQLFKTYSEKKKEIENSTVGNKVLVLKPDFLSLKSALDSNSDSMFLSELERALTVENDKIII